MHIRIEHAKIFKNFPYILSVKLTRTYIYKLINLVNFFEDSEHNKLNYKVSLILYLNRPY